MEVKRSKRVGGVLLHEISQILLKDIKDPRIGFATLTEVEVSNDLKYAKVFVSILGEESEKKNTIKGLQSASGFIRRELGSRIRLRFIPELIFKIDNSLEHGAYINKILEDLNREKT
ncbi:MAG: 30S ribosome-binding factor RbfA [Nitrospinae bacterium]|nr:30S ribosome-binding factor RbfA [Nitrospinota bacterium]